MTCRLCIPDFYMFYRLPNLVPTSDAVFLVLDGIGDSTALIVHVLYIVQVANYDIHGNIIHMLAPDNSAILLDTAIHHAPVCILTLRRVAYYILLLQFPLDHREQRALRDHIRIIMCIRGDSTSHTS